MMKILDFAGDKPAWMSKDNPLVNEIVPWIMANKDQKHSGFVSMKKYSEQQVRREVDPHHEAAIACRSITRCEVFAFCRQLDSSMHSRSVQVLRC